MLLPCVILSLLPCVFGFPRKIPIGGLFDGDDMIRKAFGLSVRAVNKNVALPLEFSDVNLTFKSKKISTDAFEASRRACELLDTGPAAIFSPQERVASRYVESLCDAVNIPNIAARWDPEQIRGNAINLYPHAAALATVFRDLIEEYEWEKYAILYDDEDSLVRIKSLLELRNLTFYTVGLYHLGIGPNFRDTLQDVKEDGFENLLIDCSYENLSLILIQALQVGIMTKKHNFIVTSLDLQTIDLEPFKYSGVNITGVRLINPESSMVQEILGSRLLNWNLTDYSLLRTEAALAYDAVQLFARSFAQLKNSVKGDLKPLYCNGSRTWEHGISLGNFMKNEEFRGLTGLIKFDTEGFRREFTLNVVYLQPEGLIKVADWSVASGVQWVPENLPTVVEDDKSLRGKRFIVLISLTDPYTMLKRSSDIVTGNARYEGFAIDITEEMSEILGFNYTFEVQTDNVYGSFSNETGWNGMIRKLMDDEAQLAITDMTITALRESAVDFTTPYMNLGISILYKKPTKLPPGLLSFLLPFTKEVWLHLIGAYAIVSFLLFVEGRLCPGEWQNPYPCIKEPKNVTTPYTWRRAPFMIIGSLLKSPTGLAPVGISTRTLTTAWWFFCLIISNTYTANLTAALSTKSVAWPFREAEDLARQTRIKYGAKKDGTTVTFFRDSSYPPYKILYQTMMKYGDEVLMEKNEDGVDLVHVENYAFFMESSSIEYITQRHCDVTQVGGLLDSKAYGIAMKKDAFYRNQLNGAVLKMKENGVMKKLYDKWWKQQRGGHKCDTKEAKKVEPLDYEDVSGIFMILISGLGLSWIYTLYSLFCFIRRNAQKRNVSFCKDFAREVKFLLKCKSTRVVAGGVSFEAEDELVKELVTE